MKLQLPHSTHLDVTTGLVLLLALAGGTILLIERINSLSLVMPPLPSTPIGQPMAAAPKVPTVPPLPSVIPQVPDRGTSTAQASEAPQVYWLQTTNNQITLVAVSLSRLPQSSETATLTAALNYLLANPQWINLRSTIPAGTRLLSLQVQPDGIHVNLSQEFALGGGTTSMTYRVAQVLYTVTSLDPTAPVYLTVEGKLLDQDHPLGGEGIILSQPLTRQQFLKDLAVGE